MQPFDHDRILRIASISERVKNEQAQDWNIDKVYEKLDAAIIGNENYKKLLSVCLADYVSEQMIRNHLLVFGGSGTGKTYLLERCLPLLNIPYLMIDASSLVPAGYKGNTLQETLSSYYAGHPSVSRRLVIVLDEFDKISEKANGGDIHKAHSIQSELLTLIQGKHEGAIDTRNALWIFTGAFSYTEQMRLSKPKISKTDLINHGFKNELLGRISVSVMTDIPTVPQVLKRVANDKVLESFATDLDRLGYEVEFSDEGFLELAMAVQNPAFGMRILTSVVAGLKVQIAFNFPKGKVMIDQKIVAEVIDAI